MKESSLINTSRIKSTEKILQTHKTVAEMLEKGKMINYYTVADSACVSRQFLYKHTELRQLITDCRVTGMSKRELQGEVIKLRLRIRALETELN